MWQDIGRRLPMAPPAGAGGKRAPLTAKQREALDHRYLQFLAAFVAKVNYLRPGETLVAPGGWRTGGKAGHAVMYVLFRGERSFTFAVSNTGPEALGTRYHPARVEVSPPKLKRALSVVLRDVPLARLSDASFWFVLFRPLVYPGEARHIIAKTRCFVCDPLPLHVVRGMLTC